MNENGYLMREEVEDAEGRHEPHIPIDCTGALIVHEEVVVYPTQPVPVPGKDRVGHAIHEHERQMGELQGDAVAEHFKDHEQYIGVVEEKSHRSKEVGGTVQFLSRGNQNESHYQAHLFV